MAYLHPYTRQGIAGYALLAAFEGRTAPGGLVRRFFSPGPAPACWAEVYADRSVAIGSWKGTMHGSPHGIFAYPYALAFGGYLGPDHLQPEDGQRVDPSIAALIAQDSFWKEVADLCAQAPAVAATPEEALAQGALFPGWMPYDGCIHDGFDQAMRLCFAAAAPFWEGPHLPTMIWMDHPTVVGMDTTPSLGAPSFHGPLLISGLRADGLPFSSEDRHSPFVQVFRAVLDTQPFWPAHSRFCRAWQNSVIGPKGTGKTIVSHEMEWDVPEMSGHARLALVSEHHALLARALDGLDPPVALPA